MLKEAPELRRYQLGLVTRAEVWTLQAHGNALRSQPSNLKVTETQPRCRRALPNLLVILAASQRHRADLLLSAELRFAKGLGAMLNFNGFHPQSAIFLLGRLFQQKRVCFRVRISCLIFLSNVHTGIMPRIFSCFWAPS